jgi:hypothetical protein
MRSGVLLAGIAALSAGLMMATPASARNLYFDIWCQEQGYDKDRCDRRDATDVAAFEEYWRQVEKFEEQYQVERHDYANFRDQLNSLDDNPRAGFHGYDPETSPRPE